jgi:hypothetical protein
MLAHKKATHRQCAAMARAVQGRLCDTLKSPGRFAESGRFDVPFV